MYELIKERLEDSIAVKSELIENKKLQQVISELVDEIVSSIQNGKKIVLCGNGGSASDALHFAGEIVGRFQKDRAAWPAVVLNADVATMTAIANDYSLLLKKNFQPLKSHFHRANRKPIISQRTHQ